MRLPHPVLAIALGVGVPAVASAQTTTSGATAGVIGPAVSRWIASGSISSQFGTSSTERALGYAASIGYVWNSWVGGEFVASFAPNVALSNPTLATGQTLQVNSFMVNAIASTPLGADAQWQPFISAGFGALTLEPGAITRSDVGSGFMQSDTRAGGNISAGVMAFRDAWGVRGDIRYFRALSGDNNPNTTGRSDTTAASAGLSFWRAHVGIAFRW